jgi:uncharacterized membrane protein YedE/YeeE
MKFVSPLLAGLVFGLGLVLSGMVDPHKVLGFLDLAGAWDPSLALVMGGALAVAAIAFRIAGRRAKSFSGAPIDLPTSRAIDGKLIGGALLFGVGWGLVGLCPGPAIANIGFFSVSAVIFVLAMAAGMKIADLATAKGGFFARGGDG